MMWGCTKESGVWVAERWQFRLLARKRDAFYAAIRRLLENVSEARMMVPESVTDERSTPVLADDAKDAILSLAELGARLVSLQFKEVEQMNESELVRAFSDVMDAQTKVLKEALEKVVELRRALKPFANWASEMDTMPDNTPLVAVFHDTVYNPKAITVAQLRQAKKALYGDV